MKSLMAFRCTFALSFLFFEPLHSSLADIRRVDMLLAHFN